VVQREEGRHRCPRHAAVARLGAQTRADKVRRLVHAWCAAAMTCLLLQPAAGQSIESENLLIPGVPQEIRHCASTNRRDSHRSGSMDRWPALATFDSPACLLAMRPLSVDGASVVYLGMGMTADITTYIDKLEASLGPGVTLHRSDRGYRLVKRLDPGAIVALEDYPDQFSPQQTAMFHISMPLGLILSAFVNSTGGVKLVPAKVVQCLREAIRPC
jgi:hypothetical protein